MKVGDYVRTKDGIIGKIETKNFIGYNDWIIDTLYYNDDEIIEDWTCGIKEHNVIKSSPNIIDLIQVGDYVDKLRVVDKYEDCIIIETFDERIHIYKGEPIKSIVTKEQFENMEYKLEENK